MNQRNPQNKTPNSGPEMRQLVFLAVILAVLLVLVLGSFFVFQLVIEPLLDRNNTPPIVETPGNNWSEEVTGQPSVGSPEEKPGFFQSIWAGIVSFSKGPMSRCGHLPVYNNVISYLSAELFMSIPWRPYWWGGEQMVCKARFRQTWVLESNNHQNTHTKHLKLHTFTYNNNQEEQKITPILYKTQVLCINVGRQAHTVYNLVLSQILHKRPALLLIRDLERLMKASPSSCGSLLKLYFHEILK